MKSLNRVELIGNIGRDSETKYTPNGVPCSKFSIATSRSWKDKASGEWKEETDWHNVVLWRAENLAPYLVKGKQIYLEGSLQTRSYEKSGEKKYVTEVVAQHVILLGGSGERTGRPAADPPFNSGTQSGPEPPVTEDDVPF